ncbi:hypothetical protein AVEN_141441-1, partial [Araneus ventricosus]
MEKCSVGKFTHSDCHLLNYVNRKAIQAIEKQSETDLNLLKLRTDSNYELKTICLHHQSVFLKNYEFLQKVCCDPFKKHKTTIKKMLHVVTVEQSRIILYKGFKVKPGQKLCASCRNKLLKIKQIDECNVQNSLNTEDEDHDVEFTPAELLQKRNEIAELNSSFHEIGCSPMKLHALGEHSRSFYGKEKLQRVHETVKEKIQNVLEVDLPEEKNDVEKSVIKKSEDLDKLVDIIKNELSGTSRRKQIQMLTIPASLMWSRRKIKETFNVSDYSVRKAQKLFKDQGFLAEPARRNGKQLSPDIIELVKKFYQLDEQSRILPGMKDVVSIGKKVYERKRLILCNLGELYSSFKLEYPNLKIGLSKFCSLRPKWCVLAGASGTHLVCVCTIHQNVILLIHGAGFEEEYKQLMSYIVCEGAGRECMLRHCDKCPPKDNLVQFLQAKFEDYDDEDIVEYNQWVSTDRTEMIRCSTSVGEFIEKLVEKLNKLIPHSYIAKSQSSFFKNLKGTASSNTAVVSMDFSENYAFTIQDEAQGYHWNSNSCTIHPVVIHCKDTSNVKLIIPLCIISDDLKHDVSMVYEIQKNVTAFLKENYPHITNIHYFSDGCAGQYKNKYNFMNLCLHEKDFKLKAQWSFFATSHGKTECDGIGGTVKRLARKQSLQQHLDRQITTTNELFEFCKVNIANITFQHISKEAVDSTSLTLESRLKDTQTLPGTRLFHNFQPIDDLGMIEARRISRDETPALTFNLLKHQTLLVKMKDLYPGCFVGCIYDNLWYFGMVSEVNAEEEDVTVKFLHPNGPSLSFFWPNREDVCAVPI